MYINLQIVLYRTVYVLTGNVHNEISIYHKSISDLTSVMGCWLMKRRQRELCSK